MKICFRRFTLLAFVALSGIAPSLSSAAEPPKPSTTKESVGVGQFLSELLPIAWQKKPKVRFNVFTEMTELGRSRPEPTPQKPVSYYAPPGTFAQTGWLVSAGERPPPWRSLQDAMQKALAGNGYVPIAEDTQRPDLLIVFTFGSHGTDLAQLSTGDDFPVNAEELLNAAFDDPEAVRDTIRRAEFIGGRKVAVQLAAALREETNNFLTNRAAGMKILPVNPDPGSPFQLLLHFGDTDAIRNVVELAFHTCYFVTATAYDFNGVANKQKLPLWQTRMTIEAQGVAMDEVLKPLIVNTGEFLGRETPESVVITKRIDREGHVQIGEAVVVPDGKASPNATPAGAKK
jgi:hypothetical protein